MDFVRCLVPCVCLNFCRVVSIIERVANRKFIICLAMSLDEGRREQLRQVMLRVKIFVSRRTYVNYMVLPLKTIQIEPKEVY